MRRHHAVAAKTIERHLQGAVLAIGGLWKEASSEQDHLRIVTVDVSSQMLRTEEREVTPVQADGLTLPFASRSFNHVVLPMVVHHLTGSAGKDSQARAVRLLVEVGRVLDDGGTMWIIDFVVSKLVYRIELLSAPVTRRVLEVARVPLVIMHDREFYHGALSAAGFVDTMLQPLEPADATPWDTITPIIGVPFLKVPRILYPVTPTLIRATRIR